LLNDAPVRQLAHTGGVDMSGGYRCLPKAQYHSGDYTLLSVRPEDIESIRQWRNAQMHVLRQDREITPEAQQQYYAREIWPTMEQEQPRQILFSFLRGGQLIGYGGLVYISWHARKAEVSVLFDLSSRSDTQYREDLSAYLTLLKDVAFNGLNLHRLWSECYDIRPLHISILREQGFEPEGRLRDHELIDGRYVDTLFHGCVNEVRGKVK
jgi:RimJ/RimL family protein N-acetyltransferase